MLNKNPIKDAVIAIQNGTTPQKAEDKSSNKIDIGVSALLKLSKILYYDNAESGFFAFPCSVLIVGNRYGKF